MLSLLKPQKSIRNKSHKNIYVLMDEHKKHASMQIDFTLVPHALSPPKLPFTENRVTSGFEAILVENPEISV